MKEDVEKQDPLPRPYEIVLLTFVYFQKQQDQEVRLDEQGLIRCMIAAHCPNATTARQILQNMVNAGYLQKNDGDKPAYTRTDLGRERTPPPPPGPIPRTIPSN